MMAVAAAHQLRSDDVTVVGLGLPQIAAVLAKRTRVPNVTLLLEIGVIEPAPTEPSMGIADPRMWQGARAFAGMVDVLGYLLHGGRVTLGILGALQIDAAGSINSSLVVQPDATKRRFTGSGGANDIASLADRVMVVMAHDSRKFKEQLDFVTSPGRSAAGQARDVVGLRGFGTSVIVTDKAVIEVGEDGLDLVSVHPGEDIELVAADVPLPLRKVGVTETSAPTQQELRVIREELDPHGWYTRN
jgi:glutaconate CoA-transferase, subunit B